MSTTATFHQYEDFMRHVAEHGVQKSDRTGTGTCSVFGVHHPGAAVVPARRQQCEVAAGARLLHLGRMGATTATWAPVYGVQWRSWPTPDGGHIDQIAEVVKQLKTNPDSRRIIVSAWNVAELSKMA